MQIKPLARHPPSINQEKVSKIELKLVKNPNWWEAYKLAIYKAWEIWIWEQRHKSIKQYGDGLEPGASGGRLVHAFSNTNRPGDFVLPRGKS